MSLESYIESDFRGATSSWTSKSFQWGHGHEKICYLIYEFLGSATVSGRSLRSKRSVLIRKPKFLIKPNAT